LPAFNTRSEKPRPLSNGSTCTSGSSTGHNREQTRAGAADWFAADVTTFTPSHQFALWHDRAVFHFLTDKADREKYVETMKRTLTPEGHAVIATFGIDGPEKQPSKHQRRHLWERRLCQWRARAKEQDDQQCVEDPFHALCRPARLILNPSPAVRIGSS